MSFEELARSTDGLDEVLFGSRVVDEGFERRIGIDVAGGVERFVQPLSDNGEDGRN